MTEKLNWALVLSGGGAKGFAHLGVINVLTELKVPPPSLVVGTSMGAIVGGLYSLGKTSRELTDFALDFDIRAHMDGYLIAGRVGRVIQTGQLIGNLATKPGMDSGEGILRLLEDLTEGKKFEDTKIPFLCNAVDLASGREIIFRKGSLARAIRASMSVPWIYEPLVEGKMRLVDGGVCNNMAVNAARDEGFSRVLAVDVSGFKPQDPSSFTNGAKVIYRSFEISMFHKPISNRNRATLTIYASGSSTAFNFDKSQEIIAIGERAVRENLPAVESFFGSGPGHYFRRRRCRAVGIREGSLLQV